MDHRGAPHSIGGEPRLGELFTELARETGTLVKKEAELAKREMATKVDEFAGHGGWATLGYGTTLAGALLVLGGVVAALGLLIPIWAASILVGAITAAVGVPVLRTSIRAIRRMDPTPRETVQTMEETRQWLTNQARR